MNDWDALRVLLATAREGSFTGAAKRLGIDATTVGRRVTRLEAELRVPLFVRSGPNVALTAAGKRVVELATEVERAAHAASAVSDELQGVPAGRVRVTSVQDVVDHLLVPVAVGLSKRYPRVRLDLVATHRTLDLVAGEADVAVRLAAPTGRHLVSRRLAPLVERAYASKAWLAARKLRAKDVTSLDDHDVLVLMIDQRWTTGKGDGKVRLRAASLSPLCAAARAGLGIVVCPDVMADGLVPLPGLGIERERAMWLVATPEAASLPRVRVVMDAILEVLRSPESPG